MDKHQIWLERDKRPQLLSDHPAYRIDDVARWTGLRMGAFGFPGHADRSGFYGANPHVTLYTHGQVMSDYRIGLQARSMVHRAGDLLCFPGDTEVHGRRWRSQGARALVIELDRERLATFSGADPAVFDRSLIGQSRFNDEALATLMQAMWREIQTGSRNGRLYAESLSIGVATHVFRRFGREAAAARGRLSSAQLARVEQSMRERLAESIGLPELAQASGLSVSHFAHLYRQATGVTPYQRLLAVRMERASVLLREGRLPLAEVATQCGFSSQSHLSDTCRRLTGRTPARLRAGD